MEHEWLLGVFLLGAFVSLYKILLVVFPLFLGTLCHAQDLESTPLNDELKAEIRTILDAGEGQVRKWLEPPSVVVVYRENHIPDLVSDAIATIEQGRNNFFGYGEVTLLDLDDISGDVFGNLEIIPRDGNLVVMWNKDGVAQSIDGDIFVFTLGLQELLYVGALTQTGGKFMRGIARSNDSSCFYSAWSRNNVLNFASVFVRSDESEISFNVCLYEELIQSLGLLNDAEGTEVFTLNNLKEKPGSRNNDRALLEALYSSSITPGGEVSLVVDEFYISNEESNN